MKKKCVICKKDIEGDGDLCEVCEAMSLYKQERDKNDR